MHFRRQRIGFEGFRAAPGRCQRAKGASVTLPPPVGELREVHAFAGENGADTTGLGRPVGRDKDALLIRGCERPPSAGCSMIRVRPRRVPPRPSAYGLRLWRHPPRRRSVSETWAWA